MEERADLVAEGELTRVVGKDEDGNRSVESGREFRAVDPPGRDDEVRGLAEEGSRGAERSPGQAFEGGIAGRGQGRPDPANPPDDEWLTTTRTKAAKVAPDSTLMSWA